MHSNFSLLKKYKLKGIHCSQKDLNNFFTQLYFKYLKNKYQIELSLTISKINKEDIENKMINYIVFGPIFKKYSEQTVKNNFNLFELKKRISSIDKKVFGSGCFTLKNISAIKSSGFQGVVLQSFIWKSDDILNAFKTAQLNNQIKDESLDSIAV